MIRRRGVLYILKSSAGEWPGSIYQVAIIDPGQPLSVQGEKVTGDIDGGGTPEFFRYCPSNEGFRYQARTGLSLEGVGRWHWYVYAGDDLEYGCTEKEYFGQK